MLKRREPAENILFWDEELSKVSEEITTFREQYIDLFKTILLQKLSSFCLNLNSKFYSLKVGKMAYSCGLCLT